MTLLIRADATTQIGTGHVMRCLALAQAWHEKGGQVVFLSHCDSQALQNRITDEGFDLIPVKNPHPHPDDLSLTLEILSAKSHAPCSMPSAPTWLVLDGYHFSSEYQKAIRGAGKKLLVIDDIVHCDHYYADVVLNQNINAEQLQYPCERDTQLLLGTKYALLRREFWPWRQWKRQAPAFARNILVTMGGSDPENVTLKVIEAIKCLFDSKLTIKVLVGPSNPHVSELKSSMRYAPCRMLCVENAGCMPDLMAWADLAVSGGGSTCWEIAFMGLPSCIVVLAANQLPIAKALHEQGAAINLGWFHAINLTECVKIIGELSADQRRRNDMIANGRIFVEGNGVRSVVGALYEST